MTAEVEKQIMVGTALVLEIEYPLMPYFTTVLSLFCTNIDTRADFHIEISPSLLCILL